MPIEMTGGSGVASPAVPRDDVNSDFNADLYYRERAGEWQTKAPMRSSCCRGSELDFRWFGWQQPSGLKCIIGDGAPKSKQKVQALKKGQTPLPDHP